MSLPRQMNTGCHPVDRRTCAYFLGADAERAASARLSAFGIQHAPGFDMSTTTRDTTKATSISGVTVPDSKLAREATELVRDTESPLLFNHSSRVYYFGSLAGKRRGLKFDPQLLYIAAMFHDMGLTPQYRSKSDRFEVDGANSARAFLRQLNIPQQEIDTVREVIAL